MESMKYKVLKQQGLLIREIYKALGGICFVSKQLKVDTALLNNWAVREGVPLAQLGVVARSLSELDNRKIESLVSKYLYALNYKGMVELLGGSKWKFETIVREILRGTAAEGSIKAILKAE